MSMRLRERPGDIFLLHAQTPHEALYFLLLRSETSEFTRVIVMLI